MVLLWPPVLTTWAVQSPIGLGPKRLQDWTQVDFNQEVFPTTDPTTGNASFSCLTIPRKLWTAELPILKGKGGQNNSTLLYERNLLLFLENPVWLQCHSTALRPHNLWMCYTNHKCRKIENYSAGEITFSNVPYIFGVCSHLSFCHRKIKSLPKKENTTLSPPIGHAKWKRIQFSWCQNRKYDKSPSPGNKDLYKKVELRKDCEVWNRQRNLWQVVA